MAITVQEAQVIFSSDGLKQVQTQAGQAGAALDRTTTKAGGLINKLRSVRSAIGGVGGMIAGLGAGAAAGWMMKLASGAESTAIQFEVLMGSADKAKQMLTDLRKLDMNSVFGMTSLGDAAKLMLSYNVAGQSVVPMLTTISQVAMGNEEKLHLLTKGFSDVVAKGRLMGQEMIQLTNAGFNPLQEISRTTGLSFGVLQKKMEAGEISTEMVARAFESATAKGGRFYNMNDRMAQTTAGRFAKLQTNMELLAIAIGTRLLPVANELIEWASKWFTAAEGIETKFGTMIGKVRTWFMDVRDNVADMGVMFGAVIGAIGPIWQGFFADMQSWAAAFFDYFSANIRNMAEDAGIAARNLKKILTGKATEKRQMTDDFGRDRGVMEFSTLENFKGGVPFKPPTLPDRKPLGIMESIMGELDAARKIRQEQRNKERIAGEEGGDKTMGDKGGDRMAFGGGKGGGEVRQGKSQTFSAEALFANIREGALNKQLNYARQQVGLQQQIVQGQQQVVKAVKDINMGLV